MRAIGAQEETHQRKTAPSIKRQIHVDHDPAPIGPFAKSNVENRDQQQKRNQHADEVAHDEPEERMLDSTDHSIRGKNRRNESGALRVT
jgi:hypothetical protein